jgi:hypothetical protein
MVTVHRKRTCFAAPLTTWRWAKVTRSNIPVWRTLRLLLCSAAANRPDTSCSQSRMWWRLWLVLPSVDRVWWRTNKVSTLCTASPFAPADFFLFWTYVSAGELRLNSESASLMKDKVRSILRAAATHGHDSVVLSALGYGSAAVVHFSSSIRSLPTYCRPCADAVLSPTHQSTWPSCLPRYCAKGNPQSQVSSTTSSHSGMGASFSSL